MNPGMDIKPNSHRYKEEQKAAATAEKKITKVVTNGVKIKKKSGISKFTDAIVSEDASKVGSYIFMDVLIPAAKKMIADIVTDGISIILYGESGHLNKKKGSSVSYSSFYKSDSPRPAASSSNKPQNPFDLEYISFETRAEANAVLDQMVEVIEAYNQVTVADLYDMIDQTAPYTANRYGWTNLSSAEPAHSRDGWILKLPKPHLL